MGPLGLMVKDSKYYAESLRIRQVFIPYYFTGQLIATRRYIRSVYATYPGGFDHLIGVKTYYRKVCIFFN